MAGIGSLLEKIGCEGMDKKDMDHHVEESSTFSYKC